MKNNFSRLVFATAFLGLFATTQLGAEERNTFRNPVIRGDIPDPSVIRIGQKYIAAGTSSEWAPFYPMFESDDLINWKQTGHIFEKQPEWTSGSFWAPELYYHNGKIFCYYTARKKADNISCIGLGVYDEAKKTFIDHGPIIEYGSEAIDAFIYDDNGQLYISWKAYGLDDRPIEILGSKLSADGMRLEGEPFSMLRDDERIGMEGQCHFKIGKYYYIVYAARGCCGPSSDYEVRVARAESFTGPYEKCPDNPILAGRTGDFQSIGHGTMVGAPDGRMFYLCHAYMNKESFFVGRQPVLHEMETTPDGWLRFKTGNTALAVQPVPFYGTKQNIETGFSDNFDEATPRIGWTWNFTYASPEFKTENGNLVLTGTGKQGNEYGTALCVRPQSASYTVETCVINEGKELKGLTIYGDHRNMVMFGVEKGKVIIKSVRDGKEKTWFKKKHKGDAFLKIKISQGSQMKFFYGNSQETVTPVDSRITDSSFMIRWDRIQRPGLIYCGDKQSNARFTYFKMEDTPSGK